MEEEISIERMLELEKVLDENIVIIRSYYSPLELEYIDLGKRIPAGKIMSYLKYYQDSYQETDEHIFFQNMSEYLNVSMEDLLKRIDYLTRIDMEKESNRELALLLLRPSKLYYLEKEAQEGISLLEFAYLRPVEKKYVQIAEQMPFGKLCDEDSLPQMINANSKKDFWVRSFAYVQIRRYLFNLYNKGELLKEDDSLVKMDIMAIENRHMTKKMNGRII